MTRPGDGGRPSPRVFTIPVGAPFLHTSVEAFRSGRLFGRTAPLSAAEIAAARIFVPTRRAGAALRLALTSAFGGKATVLPRILPLGDGEALAEDGLAENVGSDVLASVIGDHERRMALFGMVEAWRRAMAALRAEAGEREPFHVGASAADAYALAGDLARLIDETIIEDVPLARLAEALPDAYDPAQHDKYWSFTQRFLAIAAETWPMYLAERGTIDAADALKQRFRAIAAELEAGGTSAPLVILGSTGSVTATADLMAVVARLENGAVVLPGLDLVSPAEAWAMIGSEDADLPTRYAHPQVLLKRTLGRIGIAREDVVRLPDAAPPSAREILAATVLLPARATALWQDSPVPDAALDGLSLFEAANEQEEALAVALALRETLETPGATAALVTPDRALARMVRAELGRWGIEAADSAGEALANTRAGALARLALDAARPDASGADVLALLRHPDVTLGGAATAGAIAALEIATYRSSAAAIPGSLAARAAASAVTAATHRDPAPRRRLDDAALDAAVTLATALETALAPLRTLLAEGGAALRPLAAAHQALMGALTDHSAERPDELALDDLFATIAGMTDDGPRLVAADYAGIFSQMLGERILPPGGTAHPRVKIWGLLEARLLEADRVVLAGLDDGVWPPETRGDPFLNRPMRIALGLQPPERRIGQTAHDFMMLIGGRDVVLSRARKRGGAPSVASRFLRRLTAYVGTTATKHLEQNGRRFLDWARQLDQPATVKPVARPEPRIPAELMPKRLSLTEVETLYRDPYALFAKRVLGLEPLDPIERGLDARDRGNAIHGILAAYAEATRGGIPDEPEALLARLGEDAFAAFAAADPEAVAFWQRRFEAFVPWFIAWDRERRLLTDRLLTECTGRFDLDLGDDNRLTLNTRADRIELRQDGSVAITDYKTGTPPSAKIVLRGLAPQLTLTAALARRGAFADLPASLAQGPFNLSYLAVAKAGGEGEESRINSKLEPLEDVIEQQFSALQVHLAEYLAGLRGFTSRRIPQKTDYASPYDHLARHLEWSTGGGDAEDPE